MKYKLIKPINTNYSTIEQILTNRGIPYEKISEYINTTDNDINPPEALGKDLMAEAASILIKTIQNNEKTVVIIDCDADGYTSSAILINYLYDLFPSWVLNSLSWIIHSGKQHGLNDCITSILEQNPALVFLPDAGTNDTKECEQLTMKGIMTIILDHHDKEQDNTYANVIINNQIGDYPNKNLSGAGVTWQFCRYLDKLLNINNADKYRDLVALGLDADMVSLLAIETKHLIKTGLQNISNPFIAYLAEKNSYSLKGKLTPIGVAFYIAPFVNAVVRSGTQEEKEITFKSMLSFHAFDIIPSTKRGHAPGEQEKLVEQAMRVVTNVKARQTKIQNDNLILLENKIKNENLLNHKVILFLMEPGQIEKNVAGLVANKIMAKYQRPVCVLTRTAEKISHQYNDTPGVVVDEYKYYYQGSARGCDKIDIKDFKNICQQTKVTEYTIGHPNAFGISIEEKNIETFLQKTDELLEDMPNEAIYYVDYIFNQNNIDTQKILDIADMEYFWGKDIDEPVVAIQNLQITFDMVTIYDKKSLTIKIQLPNITLMIFNATEQDCNILQINNYGFITIDLVGTCNKNEWMGNITPQIFITEYQVINKKEFFF